MEPLAFLYFATHRPCCPAFFPWTKVLLVTVLAGALWTVIRHWIVIPQLSWLGAWFVRLKRLACPLAAYLLWSRSHGVAVLALLWPMAVLLLPITLVPLGPARIRDIEVGFARAMGYGERL